MGGTLSGPKRGIFFIPKFTQNNSTMDNTTAIFISWNFLPLFRAIIGSIFFHPLARVAFVRVVDLYESTIIYTCNIVVVVNNDVKFILLYVE